jgi:uncharacterized protein YwqG
MSDMKACLIDACRRRVDQGLHPAMCETIVRLLRPSIRLLTQPGQEARLGDSRIGGLPDLPQGAQWPVYTGPPKPDAKWEAFKGEPLAFLLQVNLEQVARFDLGGHLPASGLLHFFYLDTIARFDQYPDHGEVVRVRYTPLGGPPLRRLTPPHNLPTKEVYRGFALSPQLEWTLPLADDLLEAAADPNSPDFDTGLDDHWGDLADEIADLQGFGPWYRPKHRMLGYPNHIQSSTCGAPGWDLLLQVDTDPRFADPPPDDPKNHGPGMMWWDGGRVFFGIDSGDLAARRFDNVWGYGDTH